MSKLIKGHNDLLSQYPEIAAKWDYEKNEREPSDYTAGSVQKVCWICSEGHRWQATIKNRTQLHSGCPYCAGQRVITGINDLATVNPDLAVQWHPTKNGALTPAHVKYASIKRVWWLGKCGHTWNDTVTNPLGVISLSLLTTYSIFRIFKFTLRVLFVQRFFYLYFTIFTLFCTEEDVPVLRNQVLFTLTPMHPAVDLRSECAPKSSPKA